MLLMGDISMDEDRLSGAAKNLAGKVEEGVGRTIGDTKTQAHGQTKQAEGRVQDLYGQAKQAAEDTIDAVRKMSGSEEDPLRHFIEKRPYTTTAIALALGWLIGRSHRPF
jgi:uncharacterized protein YjbJ (UPF0337 family)